MTKSDDDPLDYLQRLGETDEDPIDIAVAALMLAALDHPGRSLAPYRGHLDEIAHYADTEARLAATAEEGARAIAALLVGRYGYDGDRLAYDDPQNADLIAVIDRRRGLPVALGILYLHGARAAGFRAAGLNSPGHFLLRVAHHSAEALIDPFSGDAAVEHEAFGAPPSMAAQTLEDIASAEPVSDIDVLLRLENNLKIRALQVGENARALEIGKRMALIAPRRPDLWIDLGRLEESLGALGAARKAFEMCLSLVPPGDVLHNEATFGIHALKRRLN